MGNDMIVYKLDMLLAERKMTSIDLARALETTEQTISRIKTGKLKAMRTSTLDRLCEVFDCQPSDIMEHISEEDAVERYGEQFVTEYKAYHAR